MARRVPKEMTVEEFDDWSQRQQEVRGCGGRRGRGRRSAPVAGHAARAGQGLADRFAPAIPPRHGEGTSRRLGRGRRASAEPANPHPRNALRRRSSRILPQAARRVVRRAPAPFPDGACRDGPGPPRRRRRALTVRSAQALRVRSPAFNAGWRMAEQLGAGQARAARLRPRDQRPRRAGLSGRRIDRRTAGAQRQAADVAARPARPQALRAAVGATRRCRSADRRPPTLSRACSIP